MVSNEDKIFVVVWDDGHVSVHGESDVSQMYDRADCDQMDGVTEVLAVGTDGKLQPVKVGESRKINTDEEMPFRYASAVITTTDGRVVGRVVYTDH